MSVKSKLKTTLKVSVIVGSVSLIAGGTLATLTAKKWIDEAPVITKRNLQSDSSSRMYDAKGNIIWQSSLKKRDYVKYRDLPKGYIDGLTSIENRSFFKDQGFSTKSMVSALIGNVTHSGVSSDGTQRGGSTLTQQLVKLSVFGTSTKYQTYKRKVQELYLSYALTKSFSKQQILEYYVNKLYEGHNVYGVQTISEYYYGKKVADLNLSQMAILAGIGQSPSVYDLYGTQRAQDLVKSRRNEVLAAMLDNHKITNKQYQDALKTPLNDGLKKQEVDVQQINTLKQDQAYISSTLAQVKDLGYDYVRDGLQIKTALDPTMQKIAYDELNNNATWQKQPGVQSAITITDPKTGNVFAQLGGRQLGNSLFGVNRATQKTRSSGSGIKPLIDYGPAVEYLKWSSNHMISDAPYVYAGTNIPLYNWDRGNMGSITMSYAIAQSRNITATRTLDQVGGTRASEFLNKLGIKNKGASLGGSDAIGIEASTEEMANAYGTVSNGGVYHNTTYATSIVTPDGKNNVTPNQPKQAISTGTAFILTQMMKGVFKPNQTGMDAIIKGLNQSGKTGTVGYDANANVPERAVQDSWTNGFTKGVSISMWTGYDQPLAPNSYIKWDNESMDQTVYKAIMSRVSGLRDKSDWQVPADVVALGNNEWAPKNQSVAQLGFVPTAELIPDKTDQRVDTWYGLGVKSKESLKNKSALEKKAILNAKTVSVQPWSIPKVPKSSSHQSKTSSDTDSKIENSDKSKAEVSRNE